MELNFFVDAGGHSENEDNDLRDVESEDTDTSNSNSSEGDENSDRSGEDSDPPYPSEDEDNYDSRNDGFNLAGGGKASDTSKYVSAALSSSRQPEKLDPQGSRSRHYQLTLITDQFKYQTL